MPEVHLQHEFALISICIPVSSNRSLTSTQVITLSLVEAMENSHGENKQPFEVVFVFAFF